MRKNKVVRLVCLALFCLFLTLPSCDFEDSETSKRLEEAKELYTSGTSSNHKSNYEESIVYLKQAEEILLSLQPSPERNQLLGLVRFHLGNTSESEMLYDIAKQYYRKYGRHIDIIEYKDKTEGPYGEWHEFNPSAFFNED
jgi:outer membrane protein assembly factor BamD (BamD/ComL family)